jgi:hypothetical protein
MGNIELAMLEGQLQRLDERIKDGEASDFMKDVIENDRSKLLSRIAEIKNREGGSDEGD